MEKDKISINNNFSTIRLMAAFLVFAGHMYVLMGIESPPLMLQSIPRMGVKIFFICGGYLVSKSWERDKNYIHYILKRIFRIVPAMAVYCVIAACVIGPIITSIPLKEYFSHTLFRNYFKNIVLYITYFLPGVFESNPYPNAVNGSIWSLPIEFMMYFFVPLLGGGTKLKRKIVVCVTGIICIAALIWQVFFFDIRIVFYAMDFGQIILIVPYYLLGIMVAVLDINKRNFDILIAAILMIVVSALSIESVVFLNIVQYFALPYLVFSMAFAQKGKLGKLADKLEISYGIFLYGFMIQQLMIYILHSYGIYLSYCIMLIICLLITVTFALISSKYVEKPMIKLCKKIIKKAN